MNKFMMVLGAAAVVTLAGCKDPDFARSSAEPQSEVKNAGPIEVAPAAADKPAPTVVAPAVTQIETPAPAPVVKPVEPEYTVYIVQRGDYLSKISKKYNIKASTIRQLNPSIKKDVIWVGMKLKLPGKVDVGVQEMPKFPSAATKKPASAKAAYQPYQGATKEYVVKSGDNLGAIAYGNGINIRQLKELNNLKKDTLRIGQKLKVPVDGKAAKAAAAKPKAAAPEKAKTEAVAPAVTETVPATTETAPVTAPATEPAPEATEPAPAAPETTAAPVAPATQTYVVKEGEDIIDVSTAFSCSVADIRELNNLPEDAQLVPGQVIKLPADSRQ